MEITIGQRVTLRLSSEPWIEGICHDGTVTSIDDEWVHVTFDNGETRAIRPYNLKAVA